MKGKQGTQEVDDAFLAEIERWREQLARNLALRNPELAACAELNYAVQMTIDRIVFLRICEDRGIEREEQLKERWRKARASTATCDQLFRQADQRYNSGLFHFTRKGAVQHTPDDLTRGLKIDDKVLKDIIGGLYYPSPYVFKQIPADILGQVYERFLGKVIRLTAGHQAKVEEKPEVRKAGGVYYTPDLHRGLHRARTRWASCWRAGPPQEAAELEDRRPGLRVGLVPAGGVPVPAGLAREVVHGTRPGEMGEGQSPAMYQAQGGDWQLTTAKKKRILLNNIHGVDIDPQAVEVTKLSLLLKVLEGENQESSGAVELLKERALPDLGRNIQCGNSLIGPDYYEGQLVTGRGRAPAGEPL